MKITKFSLYLMTLLQLIFLSLNVSANSDVIQLEGSGNLNVKAKQAIIIDFLTGKILLEKNAHQRMTPSSMTKTMTSYIIEEKIKRGEASFDDEFQVSEKAWRAGGSKSFMPLGKMVRLDDILSGIIIQSGNDACIVAAEGLYGTEEEFVDAMNSIAQQMGMKNTHFTNSQGWPDEDHYSTAYDLAILAVYLVDQHPEFYHTYSKKSFTFGVDKKGTPIKQGNRNLLLYKNIGCDGIKTGKTDAGGYGLIASFVHQNRRYIMVINGLDSSQARADEGEKLINWTRKNFTNKKLYNKNDIITEAMISYGTKDNVKLKVEEDIAVLTLRTKQNMIDTKIKFIADITAPVKIGDVLGEIIINTNVETKKVNLVAQETIEEVGFFKKLILYITNWFNI